jgi:hypothetical protein
LPYFCRLELPDDGAGTGYLDGPHGPLLEESTHLYKLPLLLRQGPARARWRLSLHQERLPMPSKPAARKNSPIPIR